MARLTVLSWLVIGLPLVAAAGCTQDPTDGAAETGTTGETEPKIVVPQPADFFPGHVSTPGVPRFWRLTWEQYDNAISDLVGSAVRPSIEFGFPRELESGGGWLNEARALEADDGLVPAFEAAADQYGPVIAGQLGRCETGDAACISKLVVAFGKRAWRRPLTTDEVVRYVALFDQVAAEYDGGAATTMLVKAMLQSPFFLFRQEAGDSSKLADGDLRLTPHEIASALSFGLWNRPPDAPLMAAADDGTLADPGVVAAQARRLLADKRAHDVFQSFVRQWLGYYAAHELRKDPNTFSAWTPAVGAAMAEETKRFVENILEAGGGSFRDLLLSKVSFPPAELGWIYGQPTLGARIETADRAGILMQPAVLAVHANDLSTSPTQRGLFIVRNMACFLPPPPPANAGDAPPPTSTTTTRERFEAHRADPQCAACHRYFDPIGLAFERFDSVGRYRTTENGIKIDPSARLAAGVLGPAEVDFADAAEVARKLSESPVVHACLARKALQYFWGRQDAPGDAPVLRQSMAAFLGANLDLRELAASLFARDDYFIRRPVRP
jgi:hypothetical protein